MPAVPDGETIVIDDLVADITKEFLLSPGAEQLHQEGPAAAAESVKKEPAPSSPMDAPRTSDRRVRASRAALHNALLTTPRLANVFPQQAQQVSAQAH